MKEIIITILDSFNIRLIRKPDYKSDIRFVPRTYVDRAEVKQLHNILDRLASDRLDSGAGDGLSGKELRAYMSRRRMSRQNDFVGFILASHDSLSGKNVLDVGCGMGYLLCLIGRQMNRARLIGFDPSLKSKLIAAHVCPSAEFNSALLSYEKPVSADVIIAAQVLEHLENPADFCHLLKANASSKACYHFSVPDGRLDSLSAGEYFEDNGAYTGHINFWSPESLMIFLESVFEGHQVDVGISEWGDIFASVVPSS
jgi:SAM-dependent methyltransferase